LTLYYFVDFLTLSTLNENKVFKAEINIPLGIIFTFE
jgi:hypothetical protein